MEIKFDDLPLNKPLKFHAMVIIIRSVFEENGKYYSQMFLDESLYQLQKCCNRIPVNAKELIFQKELILIKQVHQKNLWFVIIVISKILVINLNQMFVINVIMY